MLAFEPSVDVAFAKPPLAADTDCGDLTCLDEPIDGPQVDLQILEDFFGGQKRFVDHGREAKIGLTLANSGRACHAAAEPRETDGEDGTAVPIVRSRDPSWSRTTPQVMASLSPVPFPTSRVV